MHLERFNLRLPNEAADATCATCDGDAADASNWHGDSGSWHAELDGLKPGCTRGTSGRYVSVVLGFWVFKRTNPCLSEDAWGIKVVWSQIWSRGCHWLQHQVAFESLHVAHYRSKQTHGAQEHPTSRSIRKRSAQGSCKSVGIFFKSQNYPARFWLNLAFGQKSGGQWTHNHGNTLFFSENVKMHFLKKGPRKNWPIPNCKSQFGFHLMQSLFLKVSRHLVFADIFTPSL